MSTKPIKRLSSPLQEMQFHLGLWTEIIGELQEISSDESFIYLKIGSKMLSFPKESDEASYVQTRLATNLIGRKIAMLRTDIPRKPLLIRLIT